MIQVTTKKFDKGMYLAALAYYSLPLNYNRTFKVHLLTDKDTGQPLLDEKTGEQKTTLFSCGVSSESSKGIGTWVQVNNPREGAALSGNEKSKQRYPRKAKNEDIGRLANVTLDFEYPQEPARAYHVGTALAAYLEQIGLAEPGLPIEDTGAGCHIILPLPPITDIQEDCAVRWNEAVRVIVKQHIEPEFNHLIEAEGIKIDLSGYDISRVLSAPGTWRPTNPKKQDCEQLKQGYLRQWLPPYTDGRYPVRKESAKLAELIRDAYTSSAAVVHPQMHPSTDVDASQWLASYAIQHPNTDRSAFFQSLVNAVYLKYDEDMVLKLKEDINQLSGEKYNGRLDDEIERSLKNAMQLPKDDKTAHRPGNKSKKPQTKNEDLEEENSETGRQTQAKVLLEICKTARCFKTPDGGMYASVPVKAHREVVGIGEKGGFRRWLIGRYYERTENAASTTAVQQAIEIKASLTHENAPVRDLFTRVGHKDGKIYLDLANDKWQVVEIDENGWQVLDESPVYFRRPAGILPLPTPVQGGKIDQLKPFIKVKDKADWKMIVAYIMMLLHPTGPYPVLALGGEQGATKSSTTRYIRKLIDPHTALARSAPKDERDVAIAAQNNWILALENLSHIPDWLSDALCCLSTGSGFATRKLYEDDEEQVFSSKRPTIVNGIGELITKGDLLSRTIAISLPVMDAADYRDEKSLNAAYAQAHPGILGAILDATSAALRNLPTVKPARMARMADMVMWMSAAEQALGWEAGSFLKCYEDNQDNGVDAVLESSHVATAILAFMREPKTWKGSATELDKELKTVMGDDLDKKRWPANPKTLSDAIKRLSPALRARNISITPGRTNKERFWELASGDAGVTQGDAHVTQGKTPASLPLPSLEGQASQKSDAGDAQTPISSVEKHEKDELGEKNREGKEEIKNTENLASPASLRHDEDMPTPATSTNYPYDVIAWMNAHGIHEKKNCTRGHTRNIPLPWYNKEHQWEYVCNQCYPALHRTKGRDCY